MEIGLKSPKKDKGVLKNATKTAHADQFKQYIAKAEREQKTHDGFNEYYLEQMSYARKITGS